MDEIIKVTRKYQITIPKRVREKAGIEIGDRLSIANRGELIILKRLDTKRSLLELAGCWRGYPEDPVEFMNELRKLWSTWRV